MGIYEKTGKMPTQLAEKPEMDAGSAYYFEIYTELESDRPPGYMSATRIPLTAIINYAQTFGTIEDDLHTFCQIILKIDNEYLKWVNRPKPKKGAV